ncbi:MAG TPA: hypothetical protein DD626_00980, partial [Clostridiales bacterium]|nr:hypothetical protein [Clostridiales bacterium]
LKVATPYVTNKCSDLFVTGRLRQNICQAILKRWVTSVLHPAQRVSFAHEVRQNKQTILRNCGSIPCPSYFDSKDFLRVSGKII